MSHQIKIITFLYDHPKYAVVEKSLFVAVTILFISDISWVRYNIWLTMIVSRHLFILSPWNIIECPRMFFWQNTMEPSMTHTATRCINLLLNLQNKLDIKEKGQRRWSHRFMFAHKLVPHLLSQHALARIANPYLSFNTVCLFCLRISSSHQVLYTFAVFIS